MLQPIQTMTPIPCKCNIIFFLGMEIQLLQQMRQALLHPLQNDRELFTRTSVFSTRTSPASRFGFAHDEQLNVDQALVSRCNRGGSSSEIFKLDL
jgi:hypothetical protein